MSEQKAVKDVVAESPQCDYFSFFTEKIWEVQNGNRTIRRTKEYEDYFFCAFADKVVTISQDGELSPNKPIDNVVQWTVRIDKTRKCFLVGIFCDVTEENITSSLPHHTYASLSYLFDCADGFKYIKGVSSQWLDHGISDEGASIVFTVDVSNQTVSVSTPKEDFGIMHKGIKDGRYRFGVCVCHPDDQVTIVRHV
jgi:hypothetical protein